MASWRQLFLLSHILINFVYLTVAQPDFLYYLCIENGNFTSTSMNQGNLNTSLSSLSSNIDRNGFYSSSEGQVSAVVNAIALCRGDLELDICRSCVNDAARRLLQHCPNNKQAIGWYDYCMLRYSNQSFLGTMDTHPAFYMWNPDNISDVVRFNQDLRNLLDDLRGRAGSGVSLRKFATGNTSYTMATDLRTIYGLVQCTSDLSEQLCSDCLIGAMQEIGSCCVGSRGGRVIYPSCNLRYELYRFYNETTPEPPLSPPPAPSGKDSNTTRTIIIVVVPTVIFIIIVLCICIFLRKKKRRKPIEEIQTVDEISTEESLQYDFGTVRIATDDFSDANKLGQGGFGAVYKQEKKMLLLQDLRANLLPLITIFGLISSSYGQPTYNYHYCSGSNNTNAGYQSNLRVLLGSLSSAAATDTFYKNTSNGIYGLYLCRGDVAIDVCQNCVNTANQDIQNQCPSNQQAIIWYDECMLHYSNTNFFGMEQTYPGFFMWNLQNNTSSTGTDVDALALMYTLVATAPDTEMMYGADGSAATNGSEGRYGLVQCSRDITSADCKDCLGQLMEDIRQCCLGKIGWRTSVPSCNLRYEQNLFFRQPLAPPVPVPAAQPQPNNEGKAGTNTTKIVLISVSAFAVVAALVGIYLYCSLGGKRTQIVQESSQVILLNNREGRTSRRFMEESMDQPLAQPQPAAQPLPNNEGKGGMNTTEIVLISISAFTVVAALLGIYLYCSLGRKRTETDPTKCKELDWLKCENIVSGIAKGLQYLHEDSRLKIVTGT
ncbi:hypothetical protein F0562_013629 [Nyssa sinensis]|uniref:Gnk2-homologous domain-containing protein n=1 Tax=Nyssa sinensis TaxID=561372 RepID=A0A5J4ZKN4_9ASTE|nr:hypothetical protein F0562_013629 [Nyssa sinensis]